MVLILFMVLNEHSFQKSISVDLAELPDNYMVIEGYVVSKRINSIWLADDSISLIGKVSGSVKGYGTNSIKVSKNKDYENVINFKHLRLNQKVRVYCDYVRESNPPETVAFYIEIIQNND